MTATVPALPRAAIAEAAEHLQAEVQRAIVRNLTGGWATELPAGGQFRSAGPRPNEE